MAALNGLTILENGTVQTWTDPENINLGLYTFGTNYINLKMETKTQNDSLDIHYEKYPGLTFALPIAEFDQMQPFEGWLWVNTVAQQNLVKKFYGLHRTTTNPKLNLVIRYAANSYEEWPDNGGVMRKYAPGWITDMTYTFEKCQFKIKGAYTIVW
jgi:hypothetical protein